MIRSRGLGRPRHGRGKQSRQYWKDPHRRRIPLLAVVAAVIAVGAVAATAATLTLTWDSTTAAPPPAPVTSIYLESVGDVGQDPFLTTPMWTSAPTALPSPPAPAGGEGVSAAGPDDEMPYFAATSVEPACDVGLLRTALEAEPEWRGEWLRVLGVNPTSADVYLDSLVNWDFANANLAG